jgi:hypothetical protein
MGMERLQREMRLRSCFNLSTAWRARHLHDPAGSIGGLDMPIFRILRSGRGAIETMPIQFFGMISRRKAARTP